MWDEPVEESTEVLAGRHERRSLADTGVLMVHTLPRVVAAVAAATALAGPGAGAAHGDELTYADTASDVHLLQPDNSTTLHGDMVNTDVSTVLVDHRDRRIKGKFGFTDLARTGQGFVAALSVYTSDDRRFRVVVHTLGPWRGQSVLETWNGKEVECDSMRHDVDYDANTVKVSLPTDCLAAPRWVRVGLVVASTPDGTTVYIDDAQHPDVPARSTWSSKIRRG